MTSRSHSPATLEREPDWTHRQREVLDLLVKGWTNVQIAEHFGISLDGAKWHVREIMAKLDVASREEAAAYWRARNSTGARLRRAFAGLAILGRAGTVARIVLGVSVVAAGAAVFAGVLLLGHASNQNNSAAIDSTTTPAATTTELAVVPPTASPSSTVAPGGSGTTVFYASSSRTDNRGVTTAWAFHAFDTATKADLASFEFGGPNNAPISAALAGTGVVTLTEKEVAYQEMDGSGRRVLARAPEGGIWNDMAASPDGTMIAIVSGSAPDNGALTFIDVAAGTTVKTRQRTDPQFASFIGFFWRVGWLEDSSGVLVSGGIQSEGLVNSATVLLDGSVRVHEMDGFQWYAPGHQVVAITHGSSGMCTAGHEIVLRDLSTEKVTNTLTEPAEGLLPVQWSPDGSQLLFGSYPGEDVCSGAVTITYSLLPRSGGTPQPVGDVDALRRSWGSANAVSLQCVQDSNTSPFASWPQPRLSGMIYYGCGGSPAGQPASVKLGDQTLRTVAGNPPMILVLGAT